MEKNEYAAWSLYTGPSNLSPVIDDPDCPWVVGQWTGVNCDTNPKEIQKDIDQRISLLIRTLQKFLGSCKSCKTRTRNFVIPEFFFHCKQGPYPNIKVGNNGNYPLEYIKSQLNEILQDIIPDDNYYNIVVGSILTSNIDNYAEFLNSHLVNDRLDYINNKVLTSGLRVSKKLGHAVWRRSASFRDQETLSDNLKPLNDFMKECRANPLCTVRNRGIYLHYNKMMKEIETFVFEKQCGATVDLTMGVFNGNNKIETGGMITEWMANYPSYSIIKGDKQTDQFSTNSRFKPLFLSERDIGVEICLDHRLQRLRRTVDMTKENGADADNFPLFEQIIPSGGMQILDYGVAADKSCAIFNADGCDKVYGKYGDENTVILKGEAGKFKGITCGVYNQTIQSKWLGTDGNTYYSHSQLAFTTEASEIGGFNNALGFKNEKAMTYYSGGVICNIQTDAYNPTVISLQEDTDLFAASTGEIHYYEPAADEKEKSAT